MFGKLSRSSSKARSHGSRESLNETDNEFHQENLHIANTEPVYEEPKIYLTQKELNNITTDPQAKEEVDNSLQNPLVKLMLPLINKHNKHLTPNENPITVTDICEAVKQTQSLTTTGVQQEIASSHSTLKTDLYKKQLNFHLINPLITPPRTFGVHPTLLTINKSVEALKLFPATKSRFSGKTTDGAPNLAEYIYTINAAQDRLQLSEQEFKEKMLNSCTGQAHTLLRTLIQEGDNVPSLYHKLACLYDDTPSPQNAKEKLLKFKINKRSNLMEAQGRILALASSAARIFQDNNLRRAYSNTEAAQCLIRALPKYSSTIVQTKYNQLLADQHDPTESPLFVDFILYLGPVRHDIDQDIKLNGTSYDQDQILRRPFIPGQRQSRPLQIQATYANNPQHDWIGQPTQEEHHQRLLDENHHSTVHAINQSRNNKPLNTLYCSLCGKRSHVASQGCFAMRKNGVVVPVSPSQIPCNICEKEIGKKLYHPPNFCFNKKTYDTKRPSQKTTQF